MEGSDSSTEKDPCIPATMKSVAVDACEFNSDSSGAEAQPARKHKPSESSEGTSSLSDKDAAKDESTQTATTEAKKRTKKTSNTKWLKYFEGKNAQKKIETLNASGAKFIVQNQDVDLRSARKVVLFPVTYAHMVLDELRNIIKKSFSNTWSFCPRQDSSGQNEMVGILRIIFRNEQDCKESLECLTKLEGDVKVHHPSLAAKTGLSLSSLEAEWRDCHKTSLLRTNMLFVGAVPAPVMEEDFWNLFPKANEITFVDSKPKYAFIEFQSEKAMKDSLSNAGQSVPSKVDLRNLNFFRYSDIFDLADPKGKKTPSTTVASPTTPVKPKPTISPVKKGKKSAKGVASSGLKATRQQDVKARQFDKLRSGRQVNVPTGTNRQQGAVPDAVPGMLMMDPHARNQITDLVHMLQYQQQQAPGTLRLGRDEEKGLAILNDILLNLGHESADVIDALAGYLTGDAQLFDQPQWHESWGPNRSAPPQNRAPSHYQNLLQGPGQQQKQNKKQVQNQSPRQPGQRPQGPGQGRGQWMPVEKIQNQSQSYRQGEWIPVDNVQKKPGQGQLNQGQHQAQSQKKKGQIQGQTPRKQGGVQQQPQQNQKQQQQRRATQPADPYSRPPQGGYEEAYYKMVSHPQEEQYFTHNNSPYRDMFTEDSYDGREYYDQPNYQSHKPRPGNNGDHLPQYGRGYPNPARGEHRGRGRGRGNLLQGLAGPGYYGNSDRAYGGGY